MGHVRKGREALARRRESALARQRAERARYALPPYAPRAIGIIDEPIRPLSNWEIRLMLAAALPPHDPLWWCKNPGT